MRKVLQLLALGIVFFSSSSSIMAQKKATPLKKESPQKVTQKAVKNDTIDLDKIFIEQETSGNTSVKVDDSVMARASESGTKVFERTEEILSRERHSISSDSSGINSGNAIFSCTVQCRGSLYAVGARFENYRVNGNDGDKAAENAREQAGNTVCKGGGKGDFSRAWWGEVNVTSCKKQN